MSKYEFTGETRDHFGTTLRRIRARSSFGDVTAGDLGGWIESEGNLAQTGAAWVYGDAQVYGAAWVSGDGPGIVTPLLSSQVKNPPLLVT